MEDKIYRTKQGDMWDYIAWKVYGDESYVSVLYRANPQYIDIYIFDDGCDINCPDISIGDADEDNMPDWRDVEDLEDDSFENDAEEDGDDE